MESISTLYLSYDGLTDNLGRSQILPYVNGLCAQGYAVSVISCDKVDAYDLRKERVSRDLHDKASWHSVPYHKSPPILSTLSDLRAMKKIARRLIEEKNIHLIHVRSYPPMGMALELKEEFGLKVIFDMRGFYPEERIEGGIWRMSNPLHRFAFNQVKKRERIFLSGADHIITLTHSAKRILAEQRDIKASNITVIPCCADFKHFKLKQDTRQKEGVLDILYLGSLGTWYLIPETLGLFKQILHVRPGSRLHIITADDGSSTKAHARLLGIPDESIDIRSAEREEVPEIISRSDLSIFLIKESFSKAASSPTKLAEILACGLPVICNSGVGDLEEIAARSDYMSARPVNELAKLDMTALLKDLLAKSPAEIRTHAEQFFSLKEGVKRYTAVYRELLL